MSNSPFDAWRKLSAEQRDRLDRICDEFEERFERGDEGRFDIDLEALTESARQIYVQEIVTVDAELRRQRGEQPSAGEYKKQFPSYGAAITLALEVSEAPSAPDREQAVAPVVDRYRLLEKVGEGGMGVVYLAEQREPVRRRVALKFMQPRGGLPSLDDRQVREIVGRFESERQALALLDHPGIAKLYDAGTTRDGLPYFAMEFVPGIPIAKYCDEHKLGIEERLQLFVQVCEALQHAHQRGIIHRDVKPGNILVHTAENEAQVKIIDFGLARASNQRLTEKTMYTEFGRIVGTLAYMSPEQASTTQEGIDHRTDVYALGVVLYEILVGHLPIELDVESIAYDEAVRRIREEDPITPSTRWSRLNAERTSKLASDRKISSPHFAGELRGEIDWICMKALEKDRGRRYASASQFGDDIKRYLASEPVLARPAGPIYRLQKYARRNRTAFLTTSAVLVTFAAGLVVSVWFAVKSHGNAIEAEKNLTRAEKSEETVRSQLSEVMRLSDVKNLADYRAEADHLWPASSTNADRLKDWIASAKELRANLDKHRETLGALRAKALPYLDADRERDRSGAPASTKLVAEKQLLSEQREALAALEAGGSSSDERRAATLALEIENRNKRVAELEKQASQRRTWRFEDAQDAWWHETLASLVEDLDSFDETIAAVEKRFEFAQAVRRRTIEEKKELWDRAIASIRFECPTYGGLSIQPQEGLIPIGQDPDTKFWEFAHLQSGDVPTRGDDGRLVLSESMGIVLVLLPGGSFLMGADRPRLGIALQAEQNLCRVKSVTKGSLAETIGIQVDDIIEKIDSQPVFSREEFLRVVSEFATAREFDVTIRRGADQLVLSGTVGPNVDPEVVAADKPAHLVSLEPFLLSKFEMTQSQWQRFTGENPSYYGPQTSISPSHSLLNPVEQVTWFECDEVLRRLDLTLATDAQWEYAARGGTSTVWWAGSERESLLGNINIADQSAARIDAPWPTIGDWPEFEDGYPVHAPAGTFPPNPFGLHEILGNVFEWCQDRAAPYSNPTRATDGLRRRAESEKRVLRGGGYGQTVFFTRSASREPTVPTFRGNMIGVRPARLLER